MRPTPQESRVFISDCEGPITKNDNAFEIAACFLPKGDQFFSLISRYDDVLADIVKRPGYKAGYTLKLITPFLKTFDVTNRKIVDFSKENILLMQGVKEALQNVSEVMPPFIVSTSYEQYINALCEVIEFPIENVYCTKLDLDKYFLVEEESRRLKQLEADIAALPMIEIPKGIESVEQLSTFSQKTFRRLESIFWEEIPKMAIGKMLDEIMPLGGEDKAKAIRDIARKTGRTPSEIMYVGDSITDVKAFQLVKESRGLTVSFNGNDYAVKNAEVAVISDNAIIIAAIARVFSDLGRIGVVKLVEKWSYPSLRKYCFDEVLVQNLYQIYGENLPKVLLVTKDNEESLATESSNFRKTVRGEKIGRLG